MHMRHGYYFKQTHYAYSGTKELAMKKLRSKKDHKRKTCVKTKKKSAKSQAGRMIRTRVQMIRAGPDDPGWYGWSGWRPG